MSEGASQAPRRRGADRAGDERLREEPRLTVLMWEARAAAGRVDELVARVLAETDPAAEVYRSADDRVVVIDPTGHGLQEVPADLVARAPHVWAFERVER
jgi:hypothetical protein